MHAPPRYDFATSVEAEAAAERVLARGGPFHPALRDSVVASHLLMISACLLERRGEFRVYRSAWVADAIQRNERARAGAGRGPYVVRPGAATSDDQSPLSPQSRIGQM